MLRSFTRSPHEYRNGSSSSTPHSSSPSSASSSSSSSGRLSVSDLLFLPLGMLLATMMIFVYEYTGGHPLFLHSVLKHECKHSIGSTSGSLSSPPSLLPTSDINTLLKEVVDEDEEEETYLSGDNANEYELREDIGDTHWWSSSMLTIVPSHASQRSPNPNSKNANSSPRPRSQSPVPNDVCNPCQGLVFVSSASDSSLDDVMRLVTSLQHFASQCPIILFDTGCSQQTLTEIGEWRNVVVRSLTRFTPNGGEFPPLAILRPFIIRETFQYLQHFAGEEQHGKENNIPTFEKDTRKDQEDEDVDHRVSVWPFFLPNGCQELSSSWYDNLRVLYLDNPWRLLRSDLSSLHQSLLPSSVGHGSYFVSSLPLSSWSGGPVSKSLAELPPGIAIGDNPIRSGIRTKRLTINQTYSGRLRMVPKRKNISPAPPNSMEEVKPIRDTAHKPVWEPSSKRKWRQLVASSHQRGIQSGGDHHEEEKEEWECSLSIQGYHRLSPLLHRLLSKLEQLDNEESLPIHPQSIDEEATCPQEQYWEPFFTNNGRNESAHTHTCNLDDGFAPLIDPNDHRQPYHDRWIRRRRPFAIIMPYIVPQIPRILEQFALWDQLNPCHQAHRKGGPLLFDSHGRSSTFAPHLYLFNSRRINDSDIQWYFTTPADQCDDGPLCPPSPPLVRLTTEFYSHDWSTRCFASLRFADADLNATLDSHPYGPNQQYLAIFQTKVFEELRQSTEYFFLMEPDIFPIRSNWLSSLTMETTMDGHGQWWGKGANYEGGLTSQHPLDYRIHINGNGLWSTNALFNSYSNAMYESPRCPGWDHELFCYMCHQWTLFRDVFYRFRYSKFIINLWHMNWDSHRVLQQYPQAYFIHGKQRDGAGLTASVKGEK